MREYITLAGIYTHRIRTGRIVLRYYNVINSFATKYLLLGFIYR